MKNISSVLVLGIFLLLLASAAPLPANAQTTDQAQAQERLNRIEHDVMLLQRQVSRGDAGATPPAGTEEAPSGSPAQLEIRLSAIEEQLRDLRGKTEENENRVRKLSESFDKLQHDIDFRFSEMAKAPPAPTVLAPPPSATVPAAAPQPPAEKPGVGAVTGSGSAGGDNGDQMSFASPREHYNYAFRLLNQTQYEESANAFESFTKKYPKDPLVGNAYYWEGETFYIRRDYVNAADNFRKGFEALPEGPKAADNLLKLAMSLDALNRDKEACLVLQQITGKFKKSSANIAEKAEQEQKRIGCGKK